MVTCYPPRIDPWNHNNIIDVQYANCIRVWSLERRSLQERGRERVHGEGGSIYVLCTIHVTILYIIITWGIWRGENRSFYFCTEKKYRYVSYEC